MTAEQLKEADDIIADVLWWFKGFVAAQPAGYVVDIPNMTSLRQLREQLQKQQPSQ